MSDPGHHPLRLTGPPRFHRRQVGPVAGALQSSDFLRFTLATHTSWLKLALRAPMTPVTLLAPGSPLPLQYPSARPQSVFLSTLFLGATDRAVRSSSIRFAHAFLTTAPTSKRSRVKSSRRRATPVPACFPERRSLFAQCQCSSQVVRGTRPNSLRRTRLPVCDLSQFTALHLAWSAVPVIVSSLHLIRHGCTRLPAPSVGSSSLAHQSPGSHRALRSFLAQTLLGDPLPYGLVVWRRFPSNRPGILGQRATPPSRPRPNHGIAQQNDTLNGVNYMT